MSVGEQGSPRNRGSPLAELILGFGGSKNPPKCSATWFMVIRNAPGNGNGIIYEEERRLEVEFSVTKSARLAFHVEELSSQERRISSVQEGKSTILRFDALKSCAKWRDKHHRNTAPRL